MESVQYEPVLVARKIAQHLGCDAGKLAQTALTMREEKIVLPSSHWMSNLNESQIQLALDVLSISSHIPLNEQFRFSVGLIGGKELWQAVVEPPLGTCRASALGLRHRRDDVLLVTVDGAGARYLGELIEQNSGVITESHTFDRILPPSFMLHFRHFSFASRSAYHLIQYGNDVKPNVRDAITPQPNTRVAFLARNPLDTALTVAFHRMEYLTNAFLHSMWFVMNNQDFSKLREAHVIAVRALVNETFLDVAKSYVRWARDWNITAHWRRQKQERGTLRGGIYLMRMEEFLSSPDQSLSHLLDFLRLRSRSADFGCVRRAAQSIPLSPKVIPPELNIDRTREFQVHLSSVQSRLANNYAVLPSTPTHPFELLELIHPDTFTTFRLAVDAIATAVDGEEWIRYSSDVAAAITAYWTL